MKDYMTYKQFNFLWRIFRLAQNTGIWKLKINL